MELVVTELYKIKPLEWKKPEQPEGIEQFASTPFGTYEVYRHSTGNHIADLFYGGYIIHVLERKCASMEDAKEACEKHWRENMLKALRR
jgi:hypothetical protein